MAKGRRRDTRDEPAPELLWLKKRLLRPVMGLMTRLVRPEPEPRRVAPRRELPADLLLALGHGAVVLFPRGPLDELAFFQRLEVGDGHDLEFVTRGAPDAFEPHALLRLDRPGADVTLPPVRALEARWAALREAHGLVGLPRPEPAPGARSSGAPTPRAAAFGEGLNRVAARGCAHVDEARRRLSQAETLTLLRVELPVTERIAWVEQAFREAPRGRGAAHRYYVDEDGTPWLVRHDGAGKRVIRGERSVAARRLAA